MGGGTCRQEKDAPLKKPNPKIKKQASKHDKEGNSQKDETCRFFTIICYLFYPHLSIRRRFHLIHLDGVARKKHKAKLTAHAGSLLFSFAHILSSVPSSPHLCTSTCRLFSSLPVLTVATAAPAAELEDGNQVTRQVRPVGRRVSIHTHVQHKGDHAVVRHGPAVTVTQCHHMLQPLQEGEGRDRVCECECERWPPSLPPSPPTPLNHRHQHSATAPPAQRLHIPPTQTYLHGRALPAARHASLRASE